MWAAEDVVATLTARGELWQAGTGVVGLRGRTLDLFGALERLIHGVARAETHEEWRVPQTLPLEVLVRAEYFESFPHWLTLASHLDDDEAVLEAVATADDPIAAVARATAPTLVALPPAVCYHAYAALADRTLPSTEILTAQGTCWRHEGTRHAPLERGWAFTMREVVCLGTEGDVAAFFVRGMQRAVDLATTLGLEPITVEASDPFFAPTARGKALLQRVKALKRELLLPVGNGRSLAAASFNQHEQFFGEAFRIRTADGGAAWSACVAFGIERWLLAFLCAHGPEPTEWPFVSDVLCRKE